MMMNVSSMKTGCFILTIATLFQTVSAVVVFDENKLGKCYRVQLQKLESYLDAEEKVMFLDKDLRMIIKTDESTKELQPREFVTIADTENNSKREVRVTTESEEELTLRTNLMRKAPEYCFLFVIGVANGYECYFPLLRRTYTISPERFEQLEAVELNLSTITLHDLLENRQACTKLVSYLDTCVDDKWQNKRYKDHDKFKIGDWVIAPKSGAFRYFSKRCPGKIVDLKITKNGRVEYVIHWMNSDTSFVKKTVPATKWYKLTKILIGDSYATKWGNVELTVLKEKYTSWIDGTITERGPARVNLHTRGKYDGLGHGDQVTVLKKGNEKITVEDRFGKLYELQTEELMTVTAYDKSEKARGELVRRRRLLPMERLLNEIERAEATA